MDANNILCEFVIDFSTLPVAIVVEPDCLQNSGGRKTPLRRTKCEFTWNPAFWILVLWRAEFLREG